MSHAHGEVYKDGKVVGYFEYDGTSDVALARIQETREAVDESWRGDNWRECSCGNPPEEVILFTYYGREFHWPGKACFRCNAIVDGLIPFGDDYDDHGLSPKTGKPPGAA